VGAKYWEGGVQVLKRWGNRFEREQHYRAEEAQKNSIGYWHTVKEKANAGLARTVARCENVLWVWGRRVNSSVTQNREAQRSPKTVLAGLDGPKSSGRGYFKQRQKSSII